MVLQLGPRDAIGALVDVPLLRWPCERPQAEDLEASGLPFLLLVPEGEAPPVSGYRFMDWVRSPVDPDELVARRESLEARFLHSSGGPRPCFDDEALRLTFGHTAVDVAPSQSTVVRMLIDEYREIVPTEEVRAAFGLSVDDGEDLLASRLVRVRRAVRPLGLEITRVRGVGFAMEPHRDSPRRTK